MRCSNYLASLLFAAAVAAPAATAQSAQLLLQEDDTILSLGDIRLFAKLGINNSGLYFCEILSTNGDSDRDSAALRNGFLSVQEGQPLLTPEGLAATMVGTQSQPFMVPLGEVWSMELVIDGTSIQVTLDGSDTSLTAEDVVNALTPQTTEVIFETEGALDNRVMVTTAQKTVTLEVIAGPPGLDIKELLGLGDIAVGPPASILGFRSLDTNNNGNIAWALAIRNTNTSTNDGLYWNTANLGIEGGQIGDPNVPSDFVYRSFKSAKINASETIISAVQYDDPSTAGNESGVVLFETDGAGNVVSETMILKKGDFIGLGMLKSVALTVDAVAINENGDWMAGVKTDQASPVDSYILINGSPVLHEGDPSPVPGRNIADLANPELDINIFQEWVVNTQLDGDSSSNAILIKSGEKFRQEGDTFPAIAPFTLERFDSAPLKISDSGDVYWYGQTNNPDGNFNTAYYRNDQVIIQEGQPLLGSIVTAVRKTLYAFDVSNSGRFWVGEITLQGIGEAHVMVDYGTVIPIPGCTGNPGTISVAAGSPIAGKNMSFQMDDGQAVGVTPFIYFSLAPAIQGSPCGLPTGIGELLIGLGSGRVVHRQLGPPWLGDPVIIGVSLPADTALIDLELWGQGLFLDIAGNLGAEKFRLTNGFRMEIGAP